MQVSSFLQKPHKLLLIMISFFVANALIAESIGAKIFSFEELIGIEPFKISLFGQNDLSLNLTAGVILWPLEFIMTDIINEYYGAKIVKRISYIAVIFIAYAFVMYAIAIKLPPAAFWVTSSQTEGVENMDTAFNVVYGQGLWIIIGSITAFLVSQVIDATVFQKIKQVTGEKWTGLRATGSTLISQLFDSFLVIFIAFYIGKGWSIQLVLAIALMNYIYKCLVSIMLTPALLLIEKGIDKYLGKPIAQKMKVESANLPA